MTLENADPEKRKKIEDYYFSKSHLKMNKNPYIFMSSIVFLILIIIIISVMSEERSATIKNSYSFYKINGIFQDKEECKDCYNSLSIELSELKNMQGETIISGFIDINLSKPDKVYHSIIVEIIPPTEKYKTSSYIITCERDIDVEQDYSCSGSEEITIVPENGNHSNYPFDDLSFYSRIDIKDTYVFMTLNRIDIINRTKGLMLNETPCIGIENKYISIVLDLNRKNSVKFAVILTFIFLFIFNLIVLFFIHDANPLFVGMGAYFFSSFSFRQIFDKDIIIFPTFFDLYIIISSFTLLFIVSAKILYPYIKK